MIFYHHTSSSSLIAGNKKDDDDAGAVLICCTFTDSGCWLPLRVRLTFSFSYSPNLSSSSLLLLFSKVTILRMIKWISQYVLFFRGELYIEDDKSDQYLSLSETTSLSAAGLMLYSWETLALSSKSFSPLAILPLTGSAEVTLP